MKDFKQFITEKRTVVDDSNNSDYQRQLYDEIKDTTINPYEIMEKYSHWLTSIRDALSSKSMKSVKVRSFDGKTMDNGWQISGVDDPKLYIRNISKKYPDAFYYNGAVYLRNKSGALNPSSYILGNSYTKNIYVQPIFHEYLHNFFEDGFSVDGNVPHHKRAEEQEAVIINQLFDYILNGVFFPKKQYYDDNFNKYYNTLKMKNILNPRITYWGDRSEKIIQRLWLETKILKYGSL